MGMIRERNKNKTRQHQPGRSLHKEPDVVEIALILGSLTLGLLALFATVDYAYGDLRQTSPAPAMIAMVVIPLFVLFLPSDYRCLFFNRRAQLPQWSLANMLWVGMLLFYAWAFTELEPLLIYSDLSVAPWGAVDLALLGPAWLYCLVLVIARSKRQHEFAKLEKEEAESRSRFAAAIRESLADGADVDLQLDTASREFRWRWLAWTVWVCGVLAMIAAFELLPLTDTDVLSLLLWLLPTWVMAAGFLIILWTRHPRSTTWKSRWLARSTGVYRVLHPLVFGMVCVTTADFTAGFLWRANLADMMSFIPFDVFFALGLVFLVLPLAYVFWLTEDIRPMRPFVWMASFRAWAADLWASLRSGNVNEEVQS